MTSRKIEQKTHEQQTKMISKTIHVKTLLKIKNKKNFTIDRLKEKGFQSTTYSTHIKNLHDILIYYLLTISVSS